MLRALPAWRKLEMLAGLNQMALDLSYLSLRRRFPEATEDELQERLAAAFHGDREKPLRTCQ